MPEKDPTVYIALPVHNRLESTRSFLQCIFRQTYRPMKVVICDDGSTDGTSEYIRQHYPQVQLVQGNGQLWWTGGINKTLEVILTEADDSDFVLTINDDVVLDEHYLAQKIARARAYPGAIIGSACVYLHDPERIETSGLRMDFQRCVSESITKTGEKFRERFKGMVAVTHLPGKGVLIPVAVFRTIGVYDQEKLPHYHADSDFTLRAHRAGYAVYVDFDSVIKSDVNLKNMVIPGQKMTLAAILKTFRGPYAPNNFRIYYNFAAKHFPRRTQSWCFLVKKYLRIFGGLARRYFQRPPARA